MRLARCWRLDVFPVDFLGNTTDRGKYIADEELRRYSISVFIGIYYPFRTLLVYYKNNNNVFALFDMTDKHHQSVSRSGCYLMKQTEFTIGRPNREPILIHCLNGGYTCADAKTTVKDCCSKYWLWWPGYFTLQYKVSN
jgi:hypothetical protein